MTRLETRNDPDAETVLQFVGATWVEKEIGLDEIDTVSSANNCARLWEPLNESKIDEYHQAMARGDVFPMIVVEAGEKGYVILGGNQRHGAMRRFVDDPVLAVMAYVVKPLSEAVRDVVIRSLNARHGWGSDKEERIEHAVYMVRKHGIASADAARLMMVSDTTIMHHIRAEDVRASLARKGIDSSKMAMTTLTALCRVKNEKAQEQLARTAAECGATADEILVPVRAIENAKSASEINKYVRDFDTDARASFKRSNKPGGKLRRPRRDKFFRTMEALSKFLERENDGTGFSSLEELQCQESDTDKVRTLASKIVIRLKTIAGV